MALLIGLTGSIGAGKSTVAKMLRSHGVPVLDADEIARKISEQPEIIDGIAGFFGKELVINGKIDRSKLAKMIFNDKDARKKLNSIIHPRVRAEMKRLSDELIEKDTKIIVQDIPLLFENGLEKLFFATILVDAPLEMRINRIIDRDGLTKEQIVARDNAQMPSFEKRKLATFIIDNDKNEENLSNQVNLILDKLRNAR